MKNPAFISALLLAIAIHASGQDTLFFEPFDSTPGEKPQDWTTENEVGASEWQFVDGGGATDPNPTPGSRRPPNAYSGDVNALYFYQSLGGEHVMLVTPPIDLEFAILTELRFRHAQKYWNSVLTDGNDELQIYYKVDPDSAWREAHIIGEFLDAVEDWTEQVILLPEETFSPTTYFGFKATTRYGWGVCIDDVAVIETGSEERVVDTVIVSHENLDRVATGSKANPLLKVAVKVVGNTGTLTLNSLTATMLNTDDADIETGGIRLWHRYGNKDFYAADPVDTVSIASGEATFGSLGIDLPTGYTYLWVTADAAAGAMHGDTLDAMIAAGDIDISGSTYPASDRSPTGSKTIREAVFYDDFSTDKGWTFGGDFERGKPKGLGGNFLGNPDPSNAAGDTTIIGNDLSGLGALPGDYEPNVARYVNLATSPVSDLTYYNDVQINFLRWLNVENSDTASIEMSLDGGSTWQEVWTNNNNLYSDSKWSQFNLPLPVAARQDSVGFRFNLGPTNTNNHFSGWNIENFSLTGNYVEYDVGVTAMTNPADGCGHTTADTVRVVIENFGPAATPSSIPLRYSFDGGNTFDYDTLEGAIPFGDSVVFSFEPTIDLSAPGIYDVVVETVLDSDEEPGNNEFTTQIYADPTYALPYEQDFESGEDFWRASGANVSWEYGTPGGSVITEAASGTNAWATELSGNHNDSEDSYLTGPCMDFTGIDYPVFEFSLITGAETDLDGAVLEYSLDNGNNWSRLGETGDGDAYGWNWYNSNSVPGLPGGTGWTGSTPGWVTARILLDTLIFRNLPSAKFRFHFSSNASNPMEGIGIDDISVHEIPPDLGVTNIVYPVDGCLQDLGNHVTITIRNFSQDTLLAGTPVIVGYDIDSGTTVRDTFLLDTDLLKNDTLLYEFTEDLGLTTSGTRYFRAYTLQPGDIDFFNDTTTNDTTSKSINVLTTPVTFLPEDIYTLHPDTVVLDAYTGDPLVTYLWQDGSTDSVFKVTLDTSFMYHVLADNGICDFRDTTFIHFLIADAGVTDILHPVTTCQPNDSVYAKVRLRNFGTYTWMPGEPISMGLIVHGTDSLEEALDPAEEVPPDSTIDFTFATPLDMSALGPYDLSAYTVFAEDDSAQNDTAFTSIEVYGITPLDLGPDTLVKALSHTLDAGPGNDTYLWLNGSSEQTVEVDTTGWYGVTVQQGSRCASTDSVHITLVIPDITAVGITNLDSACELGSTENVDIRIRNTGNDTIFAGDTIALARKVNDRATIHDTLITGQNFYPGDSLLFTFSATADLSDPNAYQFSVWAKWKSDLIPANDTIDRVIEVFGYPQPDLGADTLLRVDSLVLDAGAGPFDYLWQDSSTERHFTVRASDQEDNRTYSVMVSNEHGCSAGDQIAVHFEFVDLGIGRLLAPVTGCGLGSQEQVTMEITNFGSDTVSGIDCLVAMSFDGGLPVNDQLSFAEPLAPGASVEYTFDGNYNLGETGEYRIDLFVDYEFDTDESNNSRADFVNHLTDPQVDLGGDNDTIRTQDLPYTLDAGEGFDSYTWNGTPGMQTFGASSTGWYTVVASNTNGCFATDSVYILSTVSVEDVPGSGNGLIIYPNPADRSVTIELTGLPHGTYRLELFGSTGQVMENRQVHSMGRIFETMDVSSLPAGLYYLRITGEGSQSQAVLLIR